MNKPFNPLPIQDLRHHDPMAVDHLRIDGWHGDLEAIPDLPNLTCLDLIRTEYLEFNWEPRRYPKLRGLHFAHIDMRRRGPTSPDESGTTWWLRPW